MVECTMASLPRTDHFDADTLHAIAAAVYVAVTRDVDHPDGGDDPVTQVGDVASLKRYVESYLDGYTVTDASLDQALTEGFGLSEDTLMELISQASAAGLDAREFFADGEFDLAGGLRAAAGHDPKAPAQEPSVREQVLAVLQQAQDDGRLVFIRPSDSYSSVGCVDSAFYRIEARGLPRNSTILGWGKDRDHLLPGGGFARGEDHQQVFWWGDRGVVLEVLRGLEPLGFHVEGGENGTRFRLVAPGDESSLAPYALPRRDDLAVPYGPGQEGAEPEYRYSTSWVEKPRRPKSEDDLLSAPQAQQLYDGEADADFFVFPGAADDELPAWCLKIRPKKKAVVTFYHRPSGSVARIIEFSFSPLFTNSDPRGSFYRSKAIDYSWPHEHTTYAVKSRADVILTLARKKGKSESVRQDQAAGTKIVGKHRSVPAGQWGVTYPPFGHWARLLDPAFGEPSDPNAVGSELIDLRFSQRHEELLKAEAQPDA